MRGIIAYLFPREKVGQTDFSYRMIRTAHWRPIQQPTWDIKVARL